MSFTLFSLPIVLPILFWTAYHLYKDRHLPEPPLHLLLTFALGVGASWLSLWLYQALGWIGLRYDAFELAETSRLGLFAYSIGVIGVVEELAKMLPFLLIVLRFREFNEPIDGIIYGSFIALGFAAVENVQYVRLTHGIEAFARGFAGPVVHIVFASIWSYFIGRAWLCRRRFWPVVFGSLVLTAVLHGIYDFLVIAMPGPALPAAAILIAGGWAWRLSLFRDLHERPELRC